MLTLGCNFWAIEIVRRMKRVAIHIVYIEKHTFSPEKYTYAAARLPVPGHFYSCVVSKYLLRENEISFLLL